ncbi:hypothetical protein HRbin22_01374 [Candidatus Thermoflexus japonica]|uniref:TadE-like protein n=1 Tax=Candidatus Thermoflexus japonica TaxID=2035417 RepID=A0A2H5Y6Q7_9CHLR|nr:hypothetical protein HRbin22_01374 [Candidatus Thermoflexus japonica]
MGGFGCRNGRIRRGRGDALVELALALPVLALMFWGVLGLMERGRTANLATWAAYACAAQASQTPDSGQGQAQGAAAARAVLGRRLVDVTVQHDGRWGGRVVCTVIARPILFIPSLPALGMDVRVRQETYVERWKSDWRELSP